MPEKALADSIEEYYLLNSMAKIRESSVRKKPLLFLLLNFTFENHISLFLFLIEAFS